MFYFNTEKKRGWITDAKTKIQFLTRPKAKLNPLTFCDKDCGGYLKQKNNGTYFSGRSLSTWLTFLKQEFCNYFNLYDYVNAVAKFQSMVGGSFVDQSRHSVLRCFLGDS